MKTLLRKPGLVLIGWSVPAALIALVLVRSGTAAAQWLGPAAAVFLALGLGLLIVAIVSLRHGFGRYRREVLTLAAFARFAAGFARLRFEAVSVTFAGLAIMLAGLVFFLAPGRPFAAAIATPVLALALWGLSRVLMSRRETRGAIERVVPAKALGQAMARMSWPVRTAAGWSFVARIETAARVVVVDRNQMGAAFGLINSLEAAPIARPDLAHTGPDSAAEAAIRIRTAGPVLAFALPAALVAWIAAAFVPHGWVPTVPPPGSIFNWSDAAQDEDDRPEDEAVPEDTQPEEPEPPEDERSETPPAGSVPDAEQEDAESGEVEDGDSSGSDDSASADEGEGEDNEGNDGDPGEGEGTSEGGGSTEAGSDDGAGNQGDGTSEGSEDSGNDAPDNPTGEEGTDDPERGDRETGKADSGTGGEPASDAESGDQGETAHSQAGGDEEGEIPGGTSQDGDEDAPGTTEGSGAGDQSESGEVPEDAGYPGAEEEEGGEQTPAGIGAGEVPDHDTADKPEIELGGDSSPSAVNDESAQGNGAPDAFGRDDRAQDDGARPAPGQGGPDEGAEDPVSAGELADGKSDGSVAAGHTDDAALQDAFPEAAEGGPSDTEPSPENIPGRVAGEGNNEQGTVDAESPIATPEEPGAPSLGQPVVATPVPEAEIQPETTLPEGTTLVPLPDEGLPTDTVIDIGTRQPLFAAPGEAPPSVGFEVSEEAPLFESAVPAPAPTQRLPAWIMNLID